MFHGPINEIDCAAKSSHLASSIYTIIERLSNIMDCTPFCSFMYD